MLPTLANSLNSVVVRRDFQQSLSAGLKDKVSFKLNEIFLRKRCIGRYFKAQSSSACVIFKGSDSPGGHLFEWIAHI